MKKITLLLSLLITSIGFSQQVVVQDFESSPTIDGFEGVGSVSIVADPTGGGNGNVLQIVTSTTGNPWQGGQVDQPNNSVLDLSTDITIKVKVYSTVAFSPMAKLESSQGATTTANTQSHSGSGWETLTFTFNTGSDGTGNADGLYTRVVFFPNRLSNDTGWGNPILNATVLFDDIEAVKTSITGPTITPPATPAPTPPTRAASDVVSFFSNAYTNIDNFDIEVFGTATVADAQINGTDDVKYLSGTAGQGWQYNFFGKSSSVDLSQMTHFHADVWIENTLAGGEVFTVHAINYDGADNIESNNFNQAAMTDTGQWVSVDVALSSFANAAGNTNYDNVKLVQILMQGPDYGPLFLDNIYFYKEAAGGGGGSGDPTVDAGTPSFDNMTDYSGVFSSLGDAVGLVPSAFAGATEGTVQINGNDTKKFTIANPGGGAQFAFAAVDLAGGGFTHVYFDWYFVGTTGAGRQINVNIQGVGANLIGTIPIAAASDADQWKSFNMALVDLTNGANPTDAINLFQFTGAGGADPFGTLYIDNVIFYKAGTLSADSFDAIEATVYPNPTEADWTIRTPNTRIKTIEVYNLLGRRVYTKNYNSNEASVSTESLASGIYLARIDTELGTKTMKLIKN